MEKIEYLNELLAAEAQLERIEFEREQNRIAIEAARKRAEVEALLAAEQLERTRANECSLQSIRGFQLQFFEEISYVPLIERKINIAINEWNLLSAQQVLERQVNVAVSDLHDWLHKFKSRGDVFFLLYRPLAESALLEADFHSLNNCIKDLDKKIKDIEDARRKNFETQENNSRLIRDLVASEASYHAAVEDLKLRFSALRSHVDGLKKSQINKNLFCMDKLFLGVEGIWEEGFGEGWFAVVGFFLKLSATLAWIAAFFLIAAPVFFCIGWVFNDFRGVRQKIIPGLAGLQTKFDEFPSFVPVEDIGGAKIAILARNSTAEMVISEVRSVLSGLAMGQHDNNKIIDHGYDELCFCISEVERVVKTERVWS